MKRLLGRMRIWLGASVMLAALAPLTAGAVEPIKIGFGMALTGGLAGNGKAALVAMQIWAEEVNAKGGLLGRPVKLIYYDDQTNPALVPGIYSKLLDIDKVDLVVSGYGTNLQAPAMPIIMQHGMTFIGLFGLDVNHQFHYDRFFQIQPNGEDPKISSIEGFFQAAMTAKPTPKTVAIVGADAEYPKVATEGAREIAKKDGLKIVYDRSYPPSTVDYTPIVHAIQATNPDLVYVASYPPDTAGMVRAAHEVGLKAEVFGGGMIGLQFAALKQQLGEMLNGIVCYDMYVPSSTMNFPGITQFLAKYQPRAKAEGADQLGFYLPPFAYAAMQVLGQAVETTKGLDQKKLAAYMHATTFHTVVGDIKWAANGEWATPRVIFVQYRGIKGNDLEQFKKEGTAVIVAPAKYKTGDLVTPYSAVQH
ncbi:MAG TPA: amino acid ABC transporter substrate-binding protein [Stellaceae bacterium]|nr:amino acid ABC transporter substrate-binding protein [Stellaceae bacterium]